MVKSIFQVIQEAFAIFSSCSGLHANTNKSHIYFGRVDEARKLVIWNLVPYDEGQFPLKYPDGQQTPLVYKYSAIDSISVTGHSLLLDEYHYSSTESSQEA
uniref:Uncharacterized protein n=1 Tax=Cannabis sativa TaxID=3483 RepID=A0A803P949_CANSA